MKTKSSEDGWRWFLNACQKLKTTKQVDDFFDLFLTLEEKENIGLRCVIVRELVKQTKTQREIASALNVSIAKITRGSNYLKIISSSLRKFLEKSFK